MGFSGLIDKLYLNIKVICNLDNILNGVIVGIMLIGNVE